MNCSTFIKGISAAATIICSYVATQYLGKNIMCVIGGAIAGTGITAILIDQIAGQIEVNCIALRQPKPLSIPEWHSGQTHLNIDEPESG
ncbi:hypothetical protein LC609_34195 [Nostoc sp. XA013]|nr:hypothetical protein [Nostoc sp. XA013]